MQQIEFEATTENESMITAVHLDADVFDYLNEKCVGNPKKLRVLVNDLLRKNIEIARLLS